MLESITLLGSSSGRNAGDAALISGIMDSVDQSCGERLLYEIPTIRPGFVRRNYENRTRPVGMNPWNLSVKMLGLPTYRSLMRSDLTLIFDAILFDRSLYNPLFNFMSTLNILLPRAKKQGKKLGFFNVGVGPVDTPVGRSMLRELADMMDFITVRDQESQTILEEIGVTNSRVILTADAALNVEPSKTGRVDSILEKIGLEPGGEILAININQYMNTWARPRREPIAKEHFLETYAAAISKAAQQIDAPILFVSTQYHDVSMTRDLMERVKSARKKALITNVEYSHYDIKGVLAQVSLLFAMRLHALILCSSSCTPIVGLAYQPKVQFYFNSLGLSDYCASFDRFTPEALTEHILKGWESRKQIRSQLEGEIPKLKREALKAAELVAAIHRDEDLDEAFARVAKR